MAFVPSVEAHRDDGLNDSRHAAVGRLQEEPARACGDGHRSAAAPRRGARGVWMDPTGLRSGMCEATGQMAMATSDATTRPVRNGADLREARPGDDRGQVP